MKVEIFAFAGKFIMKKKTRKKFSRKMDSASRCAFVMNNNNNNKKTDQHHHYIIKFSFLCFSLPLSLSFSFLFCNLNNE